MPEDELSNKRSTQQKFQEFKAKLTAKEFSDAAFLLEKEKSIRLDDVALADKILIRVKNLQSTTKSKRDVTTKSIAENKSTTLKETQENGLMQIAKKLATKPFILFVVIPTLLFSFYQLFWASDRYESQAQVIVQQPDSSTTLDASMALLSGLGVSSSSGSDPQLLETYILSNDMLNYLNETLNLKEYYSQPSADVFSRLKKDALQEDFLEFYRDHILIEIDEISGVISISAQGFDAAFAHQLTQQIVSRSEWYINNIGHQLAEAQLSFVKIEHQLNEDKFRKAQSTLLAFQQKNHLLDPTAEGVAMQQIAYGIEGQIAAKEAELKGLISIMSEHAPQVKAAQNNLDALRQQLINERSKLSEDNGEIIPVSEIMAKYTDLKISMELALQSYTSSTVSLEQSRVEAYRQLKYLITVQTATTPEKSTYPDAFYNISLFFILASVLFAIIRIIYSVIHELK